MMNKNDEPIIMKVVTLQSTIESTYSNIKEKIIATKLNFIFRL